MPVATTVEQKNPKQLSDGNSAGTILGQSASDNISFYNSTPVPQLLQGSLAGQNGLLSIYSTAAASPTAVVAHTTAEFAFTATGAATTDMVVAVSKPTAVGAGLAIGTGRVNATNSVSVTFGNVTGATVTPTTNEIYTIVTVPASLQLSASLTPASVAAATTVEQNFTVAGVQPGMALAVSKPTLQAGLMVTGARVVAANTVAISFMNVTTATTITPTAAETYTFFGANGLRVQPVMQTILATLAPVSVAANTTAEQTFTVAGLISGNAVEVTKPSVQKGLAVVGARISAANTLALAYANTTAAAITPNTEQYIIAFYPDVPSATAGVVTQLAAMGVDPGYAMQHLGLIG